MPGLSDWKFSATSEVIGSTVDEPEMLSEPVSARPRCAPVASAVGAAAAVIAAARCRDEHERKQRYEDARIPPDLQHPSSSYS